MRKFITAFGLAAVIAVAGTAIVAQPAEAHISYHGNGKAVAAGIGGLALGLALGGAAAPAYVYPAPAYYPPPVGYYPAPVYYPVPAYGYYAPAPVIVR